MASGKKISGEEWEGILAKWHISGASQRGFCREEGISYSSFTYWRKKLSEEHADTSLVSLAGTTKDMAVTGSIVGVCVGLMRVEFSGEERKAVLVKVLRALRVASCSSI